MLHNHTTARRIVHVYKLIPCKSPAYSTLPHKTTNISALLSQPPTWSPQSLLPTPSDLSSPENQISPEKLRHLLRLSGLPPPRDLQHEKNMSAALSAQMFFVRSVQAVNTEGLKPLNRIGFEGRSQETATNGEAVGSDGLVLGKEEYKGTYLKKIKRVKTEPKDGEKRLDVFGSNTTRKIGRYFLVRRVSEYIRIKGILYR